MNLEIKRAEDIEFRCHWLGDIMSGVAKGWNVEKSLTCKKKLIQIHREITYNRVAPKKNKYIMKGLMAEEDGLTLYSMYKNYPFHKNTTRLSNGKLTGEIDTHKGDFSKPEYTVDIKNAYTLDTLPTFEDKVDVDYKYQGLGYLELTGADLHIVAHVLVNSPPEIIEYERKKLARELAIIDVDNPPDEYIEGCKKIEINHIFDIDLFQKQHSWFDIFTPKSEWIYDIPIEARVQEFMVERDAAAIQSIYDRIDECREWMNKNLFKL